MGKAVRIGTGALDGWRGDARLYQLDPPLSDEPWDEDETPKAYEYVVVSAIEAFLGGPETYIFGADATGKVDDWLELPGSFKGALDHEAALRGAGYTIGE